MHSLIEKIYYSSPVFMQNCAVSLMGLKLYAERYGKAARRYEQELAHTRLYTGDQLLSLQSERFVELARSAIKHTKFYSNWAKKNNITLNDIQSLDDINRFPVIDKSILKANSEDFVIGGVAALPKLICLHTSGTTGSPLSIYCSKDDRTFHYAFFTRLREIYGVGRTSRRVTMFGRIIMLSDQLKPPFWRYDAVQKNLLMSSYHLSDANLKHYYDKLIAYNPDEIFAYPSSIVPIAKFIKTNKLPRLKLKLIMTTAEPLFDYQREALKSAFDASIVNQYGCTEMAFFAEQKPNDFMRFHPEHGIVEVLDSNGSVQNTGCGELVATGLVNRSMPIIRYRVGDSVELSEIKPEARGDAAYAALESFTGRTDDLIFKKDGTPVGRLDPVFKGGSNIKAAQIIQLESGDINLFLEPDEYYTESNGASVKAELQKRVGNEIAIKVFTDKAIKKMANGKFKAVCSMR